MANSSFDDSLGERKLLIAIVGLLLCGLCFFWIKSHFPALASLFVPAVFRQAPEATAAVPAPAPRFEAVFPVNINTADAAQLQQLPGVGPVLAQRIIAYRDQRGGFKDSSELLEIKGIGPKIMARLADKITLQ